MKEQLFFCALSWVTGFNIALGATIGVWYFSGMDWRPLETREIMFLIAIVGSLPIGGVFYNIFFRPRRRI